ncbi:unnamed protein product [Adineta steineri]|uniref:P-type ATPase A domain-containing protein n=2 Tax=Adineta steineri TaxID=433720 RepID=A0A815N755_9BILA|nr:unnamed protein product [Adineta steineri]CAF1402342.1 unnamed protein product [Adineta steineri]CAF1430958.1 unnamed protein product [Adineta steineri]
MAPGTSSFVLTKKQLYALANERNINTEFGISHPYDGIEGVLRNLRVRDLNQGLDASNQIDLEERRSAFGKNQWSGTKLDRQATVLRNGKIQQIPIVEVVVGDVCHVKAGDKLWADGLVIESKDLKIDESELTGEADFVNIRIGVMILADTDVKHGTGKMVVTGVGIYTLTGAIDWIMGHVSRD